MTEKSRKSAITHVTHIARLWGFDIWNQHHGIHIPGKFGRFLWNFKFSTFLPKVPTNFRKKSAWSKISQIFQDCVFHDADSKYQNLKIDVCHVTYCWFPWFFLSSRSLNRPKHPQKFVSCKISNAYLKNSISFYLIFVMNFTTGMAESRKINHL